MRNHNREIESLSIAEGLYQFKKGNVCVEMVYSKNNKSFNECMLNILRQKIGK